MTIHHPQTSAADPDARSFGPAGRVYLPGDYDGSNSTHLVDALLADADAPVVVGDLSATTFMDSTSVRALLEVRSRLAEDGRELRLVNPSPIVRRLFDVLGLSDYLGVDLSDPRS